MAWGPPAAWAAVIFGLSAMPSVPGPSYLSYPAHFIEYAVLGGLLYRALRQSPELPRAFTSSVAVAMASVYGLSDEIHQLFVPGRQADPVDWMIDTAGAVFAVLLIGRLFAARVERGGRAEPRR